MTTISINLSRIPTRTAAAGTILYRLNDFHEAAMAAGIATANHAPGEWARKAGKRFLDELEDLEKANEILATANGRSSFYQTITAQGELKGTYASEMVVYRYAAYLSVEFEIEVYRVFQASRQRSVQAPQPLPPETREQKIALYKDAMSLLSLLDMLDTERRHMYAELIDAAVRGGDAAATKTHYQAAELARIAGLDDTDRGLMVRCGQRLSASWRFEHGTEPATSLRRIDGTDRPVKTYPADWALSTGVGLLQAAFG